MLCFDKLTGEHNNKKTLLKFLVLWEYIFKDGRAFLAVSAHQNHIGSSEPDSPVHLKQVNLNTSGTI